MLNAQFDGDVLVLRPAGPVTREDVAALTRTADEYLAAHAKISSVMVQTQNFPGFASPLLRAARRAGHRFSPRPGSGAEHG